MTAFALVEGDKSGCRRALLALCKGEECQFTLAHFEQTKA
jgi:hypothetical protein